MPRQNKAWNRWLAHHSDERLRLRVKINDDTFEADGPSAYVVDWFDGFRQLLAEPPR